MAAEGQGRGHGRGERRRATERSGRAWGARWRRWAPAVPRYPAAWWATAAGVPAQSAARPSPPDSRIRLRWREEHSRRREEPSGGRGGKRPVAAVMGRGRRRVEHDGGSGGKRPAVDDSCSIFAIFFLFLFSRAGDVSTRKQKTNFRVRVCHLHGKFGFSQTL